MSFRDLLRIALGNLRRQKLRTSLTVSGVIIAIGAFVAMLSFGAGNQRMIADQFDELGFFTTMLVYPGEESDSLVLDSLAIERLSKIPGVRLAYPYDRFDVELAWRDTTLNVGAQALPIAALETRFFSRLEAGVLFEKGDHAGAIVTENLLDQLGVIDADSMVGERIAVSVKSASLDSALAGLFGDPDGGLRERISVFEVDSLFNEGYLEHILRRELNEGTRRFIDGYLNAQALITDTLTVRGVIRGHQGHRNNIQPLILSMATARRFDAAGPSADPLDLVPRLMKGEIFSKASTASKDYSRITLELTQVVSHPAVADSVEGLGYRSFSYASQFEQIRRMMLFFNMGLGLIGLVALVTAALGIANTMIMSILERRREIGILRSLGAESRDIRELFLVESAAIGALGASGGVLLGWSVARLASAVAKEIMRRQEVDVIELFATPLWLVGLALAFGILVAVVAGAYPASRASRVDPVEALRQD